MRSLFESGKLTEVEINGHLITMHNKSFVVRQKTTNFKVLESSTTESYEWVKNYVNNLK